MLICVSNKSNLKNNKIIPLKLAILCAGLACWGFIIIASTWDTKQGYLYTHCTFHMVSFAKRYDCSLPQLLNQIITAVIMLC